MHEENEHQPPFFEQTWQRLFLPKFCNLRAEVCRSLLQVGMCTLDDHDHQIMGSFQICLFALLGKMILNFVFMCFFKIK
jgi:hypothetical protein